MKEIRIQRRKGGAIPHCAAAERQSTVFTRGSFLRAD